MFDHIPDLITYKTNELTIIFFKIENFFKSN